jgi:hypothetical protein
MFKKSNEDWKVKDMKTVTKKISNGMDSKELFEIKIENEVGNRLAYLNEVSSPIGKNGEQIKTSPLQRQLEWWLKATADVLPELDGKKVIVLVDNSPNAKSFDGLKRSEVVKDLDGNTVIAIILPKNANFLNTKLDKGIRWIAWLTEMTNILATAYALDNPQPDQGYDGENDEFVRTNELARIMNATSRRLNDRFVHFGSKFFTAFKPNSRDEGVEANRPLKIKKDWLDRLGSFWQKWDDGLIAYKVDQPLTEETPKNDYKMIRVACSVHNYEKYLKENENFQIPTGKVSPVIKIPDVLFNLTGLFLNVPYVDKKDGETKTKKIKFDTENVKVLLEKYPNLK